MSSGVKISRMGPFEHNPNGNLWLKDENTFGHKLLTKMGWSKGKGLGKNEDGIKENIKVLKKQNLAGVGFTNDLPISVGCVEYENILSRLQEHFKNKEPNKETNLGSLEQRSRNSRNHLHYQKFVRVKDLFRYSEKDMKCIFLEKPENLVVERDNAQKEMQTFKSQLSINDYFAMKKEKKFGQESDFIEAQPCTINDKKRKEVSENSKNSKRIKLEDLNKSVSPHSTDVGLPMKKVCGRNLKSCLKSSSAYGKSKRVSFNESYKYEPQANECGDILEGDSDPLLVELSPAEEDVSDQEEIPKCFELPKCVGSSYNFWLESQRQAMKMKLYKSMIRKMRNHCILQTTNLLDIKGYGNWGF